MAHDVFICHSSDDAAVAERVRATLESREKRISCWIAPRDVPPGHSWAEAIIEAIRACRVFVLILSNSSNKSNAVISELLEAKNKNIRRIPFRIENVEPSLEMGFHINDIHWLDAITPPLETHLQRLADAVQEELDAQQAKKPALVNPQEPENPPVGNPPAGLAGPAAPRKPVPRRISSWIPLALVLSILLLIVAVFFLVKTGIFVNLPWSSTNTPTTVPTNTPGTGNIASPLNTSIPFFNIYTDSKAEDNHFFPTGKMGDVDDIEEINQSSTDTPYSGLTDIRFVYNARGQGTHLCPFGIKSESICQWAGLYWLNPADNFGAVKGAGFNLTGFQKLSFWARSDAGSSGLVIKFLVGGAGCQIPTTPPYPDSLCPPRDSGWQILTDQWQHIEISLKDADLSYVIGGFAWVIDWGSNEISLGNPKRIVFYVDEIRFER